MCKDSVVNFRINSDLKNNAQNLVKKLGYKNLSSFLREYIEDLSNFYNKDISELDYLEEFYNTKLNSSNDPGEKYFIKRNISMIKQFKEILQDEGINSFPH